MPTRQFSLHEIEAIKMAELYKNISQNKQLEEWMEHNRHVSSLRAIAMKSPMKPARATRAC